VRNFISGLLAVLAGTAATVSNASETCAVCKTASHLLRDAFLKQFEVAVLISNDSDLAEPVRIVSQELKFPVGIINPHQYYSKELQRYATFVKRIRQGDLIASQFPATVHDAKGGFSKPAGW